MTRTALQQAAASLGSDGERALEFQLTAKGIRFEREVVIAPPRKWKADFLVHPDRLGHALILVEVEGGIWTNGAHVRGRHFESDARKYNAATLLGYRVLRCSTEMVESGECLATIEQAVGR